MKIPWKKIKRNQFLWVFVGYFTLLSILRFRLDWGLIWWWLGGILGVLMDYADRLVYVYYVKPNDPLSLAIKRLVKKRKYKISYIAFQNRGFEQQHLALHSILFLIVWIVIALYVITSSGSMLAAGLILGLGLQLLFDMLKDYQNSKKLKAWLFWQIKRPISDTELKVCMAAYIGAFILMSGMMI